MLNIDCCIVALILGLHFFAPDLMKGAAPGLVFIYCCARIIGGIWVIIFHFIKGKIKRNETWLERKKFPVWKGAGYYKKPLLERAAVEAYEAAEEKAAGLWEEWGVADESSKEEALKKARAATSDEWEAYEVMREMSAAAAEAKAEAKAIIAKVRT